MHENIQGQIYSIQKYLYQSNIIYLNKIQLDANNLVRCFPAAVSPQTDPAVISPHAPSSPSPRAHKSSRGAVTPARPRGPGWHSVFHYKLVSLAERHNPNTLAAFIMERALMFHSKHTQNKPAEKIRNVCFLKKKGGAAAPGAAARSVWEPLMLNGRCIYKTPLQARTLRSAPAAEGVI